MKMCCDGALVMPSNYAVMNEEEMSYVEGGALTLKAVGATVTLVIATAGATYTAGEKCGERLYYAGINSSKKWAKYKYAARAAALVGGGPAFGPVFLLGLENKLYSMM